MPTILRGGPDSVPETEFDVQERFNGQVRQRVHGKGAVLGRRAFLGGMATAVVAGLVAPTTGAVATSTAGTEVPVQLGPATNLTRAAPAPPPAPARPRAVDVGLTKIGAPYRYGATGPNEFDCSGFTQWSFAQTGVRIPRTSRDQSRSGTPVPLSRIRRGDLVFSYSPVSHVGFYLGDGTVLHEPTTGGSVKITAMRYLDVRSARRY